VIGPSKAENLSLRTRLLQDHAQNNIYAANTAEGSLKRHESPFVIHTAGGWFLSIVEHSLERGALIFIKMLFYV
jgi:hypothetical protein